MKKEYLKPEVEMVEFDVDDIITTSGDPDIDYGGDED